MVSPFLRRRAGWSGVPGTSAHGGVWLWMAGWMLAAILPAASADASCGDWLEPHARGHRIPGAVRGGLAHEAADGARHLAAGALAARGHLAGRAAGESFAAIPPSSPAAPPCDGPACRRAPSLPPAAPVPSPEPTPGESALPAAAAALPDGAADASAALAADARPIRVVGRVPTPPPRPTPA